MANNCETGGRVLYGEDALAFLRRAFCFVGWQETSMIRSSFVDDDGYVSWVVQFMGPFVDLICDGDYMGTLKLSDVDFVDRATAECIAEQLIAEFVWEE